MKALGIAAAAAIALAPFSVVATTPGVAQAAPCAGDGANDTFCQECLLWVAEFGIRTTKSCYEAAPARPAQAPSTVPVQIPEAPPQPAPREPAPPEPAPTTVTVVQTPPVVQPSPAPSSTSPVVAAHEEPTQPTQSWWPSALRYGALVIVVGLVAWMINRRTRESGADR